MSGYNVQRAEKWEGSFLTAVMRVCGRKKSLCTVIFVSEIATISTYHFNVAHKYQRQS